ncbi:MAG: hypothetical protein JXJ22_03550, partial [Bacteroidales bacterium]|nr:hypothetical protein [Bacteroidales bacterium]
FIVLVIFATFFGIIYVFVSARNKERMALIEKNADAKIFYPEKPASNIFAKMAIKIGMLGMGVGLGIFIGYLLSGNFNIEEGVAISSMIFIFGGAGLFASYYVAKKAKD